MSEPRFAIVGATGAVGREAVSVLASRGTPAANLGLFASRRSAGAVLTCEAGRATVAAADPDAIAEYDAVILATDAATSRVLAPRIVGRQTLVVDTSSAFREDPEVPLVVPEINGETVHSLGEARLLASPNCSTVMMLVALEPIRQAFGIRSITVTTYQAVSGAGQGGLEELRSETGRALRGEPPAARLFPVSCAFDVFPHESSRDGETGMCGEELKIIAESRRIWNRPALRVLPTCVRVPVERAHAQSIVFETEEATQVSALEAALDGGRSLQLWGRDEILTPARIAGTDEVHVSSVRADPDGGGRRFVLWACCDQLRKGAALNAVQVCDLALRAEAPGS